MKSVELAWRENGVDEDMPVHNFFLAGWDAAIEAMAGVQEQLDLALGTLESREREIEMILAESARRQKELDQVRGTSNRKRILRGLSMTGLAFGIAAICVAEPSMKTYWYLLAVSGMGIAFNAWLLTTNK